MEYVYPVGTGIETQSLGTLLRSQSSQSGGGTQGEIQSSQYQSQSQGEPQQGELPNNVGNLIDVVG